MAKNKLIQIILIFNINIFNNKFVKSILKCCQGNNNICI